jgi:L-malate glycosyltransferase
MNKVLFIIDRLSAGAGRVLYDLAKNVNCSIISIYKEGDMIKEFKKLNKKIIFADKKKGMDLNLILRLRDIIKKEKPDIVHTHNVDAYEYGVLAGWLADVKKIIHTAHGKSVKNSRLRENTYHKFISIFLDKYITVSYDLGKYVKKNWCLSDKKIHVIHNGVDCNVYKKIKADRQFLSKYGIKKNDFVVGIIAGLRKVKNHRCLIKAVKKYPEIKLLIVGDGSEKENIKKMIEKLNLKKNIIMLGNRKDIVKIFNVIDVNILCSHSECLSMTLLEAMACGIPSIVTDVGGNKEVIANGINGFLIKNDYNELSEKIKLLKNNKKLREKMSKECMKKVKEFSIKKMIEEYEKVYLK